MVRSKKQLDLIVAVLLPVSILAIGFLRSRAMAGNPAETFVPTACGNSYRSWFGGETPHAPGYCPGQNVSSTTETASFSAIDDDTIHWHRFQYWTFGVTTPWGSSTCNVTLYKDIPAGWFGDSTDYTIGYWNGTESSWRKSGDPDTILVSSDTYRWFRKVVDGTNYRCPKYRVYETSQSFYDCISGDRDESGLVISDFYNDPPGAMIYPGDDLVSTQAASGATYNCVSF